MYQLTFRFHFCGMSEATFTEQIMIFAPLHTITRSFSADDLSRLELHTVGALITHLKAQEDVRTSLGDWGMENFQPDRIYVWRPPYLLGLREDKPLEALFSYFDTAQLELCYFVVGGASIHSEDRYRFTVHPAEQVHLHEPHVHVEKEGVIVRYSLETLEPMDDLAYPHRRDKKKIAAFLRKNREVLMGFWTLYMDGYSTPALTETGEQFYPES